MRTEKIKQIKAEIEKGEYLTDEKESEVFERLHDELCGCSSRSTRDAGFIAGICWVGIFVAVVVSLIILKVCGL